MYDAAPPTLRDPIVLVHGLCGFASLFGTRRPAREYFPGIRQYLEAGDNVVLAPRVCPTGGIERRANDLRKFLNRELPGRKCHLIGHSLGGLDARYLVSRLGMEDRVRTVTTVGTPHRGTTFADWGVRRFARYIVPFLRSVGVPYEAFFDLMVDACLEFNESVPDVPGVRYFSVAGRCEKPWLGLEWRLPSSIVGKAEGPNDGVVSVASAAWGEHADVWDGDHLNLVNWPNRRAQKQGLWLDRAPDYGRVVRRLADAGFAAD